MALQQAIKQWPDYWLAYFLLANDYLESDVKQAVGWYQKGLEYASEEPDYLNNYAYALSHLGCNKKALEVIGQAKRLAPDNANIEDTIQSIAKKSSRQSVCGL